MPVGELAFDDDGYEDSRPSTSDSLLAPEVLDFKCENGRLYSNYGRHKYLLPVDKDEQDRMDLQHIKYKLILDDRLYLSPIRENPTILDLGTGTGIWPVSVADDLPSAIVMGVDSAPIQRVWVPPNCEFQILDVETSWGFSPDYFDFIHVRDLDFVIHDWDMLLKQAFRHLKPGGFVEVACTDLIPASDDGSLPESSMFRSMCEKLTEALIFLGLANAALDFQKRVQRAGFVHVKQEVFKIPCCPWPDDQKLNKIGILEGENLSLLASAFGRLFTKAFDWTQEQTEVNMVGFRKDSAKEGQYRHQ